MLQLEERMLGLEGNMTEMRSLLVNQHNVNLRLLRTTRRNQRKLARDSSYQASYTSEDEKTFFSDLLSMGT